MHTGRWFHLKTFNRGVERYVSVNCSHSTFHIEVRSIGGKSYARVQSADATQIVVIEAHIKLAQQENN